LFPITFGDIRATFGGALNAINADISFHGNNFKQLINTSGRGAGFPCTVDDFCHVTVCGYTSTVTFTGNNARHSGGAIFAHNC